jgi:tripartite-type tricarboxylate transporter receptor subunit TctC
MQPLALLVNPSVPVKSLNEFVAYAKAKPGQVNYGSAGNGGISHLVPEMFKTATGLFMVHIPYRGSAPAFTDLMAGQVQFMAESIPQAAQYHKQGKVRALAVTTRERSAFVPDVPTFREAGIADIEATAWIGIVVPAKTPAPIVERLNREIVAVLKDPGVGVKLRALYMEPAGGTPAEFAEFMQDELRRWAPVIRRAGVTID